MKPSQIRLFRIGAVVAAAIGGLGMFALARRKAPNPDSSLEMSRAVPVLLENTAFAPGQPTVSVPESVDHHLPAPHAIEPEPASPFTRGSAVRAAAVPLSAAIGLAFWVLAQARLMESRQPAAPLLLYALGLALVIPALRLHRQTAPAGAPGNSAGSPPAAPRQDAWDAVLVLAAAAAAVVMQARMALTTGSLFAVLLVPAAYGIGRIADTPLTGVLAAAFTALSAWPLALAGGGVMVSAPAVAGATGLALMAYGLRRKSARSFTGGALVLALSLAAASGDLAATSWSQAAADGLSPLLTLLDSLSASLLLFNLTGDPNPLHGLANRPVFAPVLSALFAFGLLAWAARVRRWPDALPPVMLVVALLPSALSVYYPDAQRAALALPVAIFFAAYGMSVVARLLVNRLGSLGAALALWLVVAALMLTAADAAQFDPAAMLPAIEQAAPP